MAWAALTVYDVWDSRQDDSEEDSDNVDDWGTVRAAAQNGQPLLCLTRDVMLISHR